MPGARIPGFLDIGHKQIVNQPPPINGAPREFKKLAEILVEGLILFPPPSLVQTELYNHPEGEMACWITVAEMIVKHRNAGASFIRPHFADVIPTISDPTDPAIQKIRYRDFVEKELTDRGFEPLSGGLSLADSWDTPRMASTISKLGPLLIIGDFGERGTLSLPQDGKEGPINVNARVLHTLAVFGAQTEVVYFRNPGNGNVELMDIKIFNAKGADGKAWGPQNVWSLKGFRRVVPRTLGA